MIGISFIGIPVQAIIAWAPTYFIRIHGFKPGEAGLALGLIFLGFGASGMVAGGFITDWFKGKGYDNAPIRTGLLAAVLAIPFAVSATIVAGPMLSLALLGPLIFCVSIGVGAAPTGLQLVTPNHYRAQVAAVFLLLLNLIATGFAPLLTAMATDYVFRNEAAVGMSLSLVCGLATPIAAVIFVLGLKSYGELARKLQPA
jgi:MFS family permease